MSNVQIAQLCCLVLGGLLLVATSISRAAGNNALGWIFAVAAIIVVAIPLLVHAMQYPTLDQLKKAGTDDPRK